MTGNDSENPELTAKQLRAIQSLLKEPTTAKAAKAAQISEVTLFRWLQNPAFSEAYREARERILEGTLTLLQSASVEAVEVLRKVMKDAKTPASSRVTAARSILELSFKAREVLEIEERLRLLEARLLEPKRTNKVDTA